MLNHALNTTWRQNLIRHKRVVHPIIITNKYFQWFVPNWRSKAFCAKTWTARRNFFHINDPGMGRFKLFNLGVLGYGLWVTVKVLGSDCNNRFPNTNHNLNHNSNDNLTLNRKSNPKLTLTLTLY